LEDADDSYGDPGVGPGHIRVDAEDRLTGTVQAAFADDDDGLSRRPDRLGALLGGAVFLELEGMGTPVAGVDERDDDRWPRRVGRGWGLGTTGSRVKEDL